MGPPAPSRTGRIAMRRWPGACWPLPPPRPARWPSPGTRTLPPASSSWAFPWGLAAPAAARGAGDPDQLRQRGLVPTGIIIAGMPSGILVHGRSFFHRAVEQGLAVAAAGRGGSAGRSLPLKENHDLRGADGPHTRHREAADDPPALGRIAVERVLQVLWTELAGPPAVLLAQHFVFHGLSTSSKRPANCDFYRIPTALSRVLKWDRPARKPTSAARCSHPSAGQDTCYRHVP